MAIIGGVFIDAMGLDSEAIGKLFDWVSTLPECDERATLFRILQTVETLHNNQLDIGLIGQQLLGFKATISQQTKLHKERAELVDKLGVENRQLEELLESLKPALPKPANLGDHYYPGIVVTDTGEQVVRRESDCPYCGCWVGPKSKGGPKGVDPMGECPGNQRPKPKLPKKR